MTLAVLYKLHHLLLLARHSAFLLLLLLRPRRKLLPFEAGCIDELIVGIDYRFVVAPSSGF